MRPILAVTVLPLALTGCMGIGLPFTDYRLMDWPVDISRQEVNSTCTDIRTLTTVAKELEARHLAYIRSKDAADAMEADVVLHSLGDECLPLFTSLDNGQIKTELFGDVSIISDPDKLQELGGYLFVFSDTRTEGGLEITLHLDKASTGPDRKMVAIYSLATGKVIHFNYSGTDNVDTKSRGWPLDEFFGVAVGAAGKLVIP